MDGLRRSNGQTDAELMQAAEVGEGAFAELYGRHVSTVHAWFRRRLEWAASDLTAATSCAPAWLSRGSHAGRGGRLRASVALRNRPQRRARVPHAAERRGDPRAPPAAALRAEPGVGSSGYAAVQRNGSRPAPLFARGLETLPEAPSVKRSSCASLMSCRTSRSRRTASAFVRKRPHVCESPRALRRLSSLALKEDA